MTRTSLAAGFRALRRRLRRLAERLGPAGIAGAALLAGCLGFYASSLQPLARQIDALEEARVTGQRPQQRPAADGSSESLRRFAASFPDESEVAGLLTKLYALGERAGVRLAEGEYRFVERDALGMVQYKIMLPVSGGYPRIRRFVGAALAEIPWVAVTQVNLQRERVSQGRIDARLELTLHLRARTVAARETAGTEPISVAAGGSR